MNSPELRKSYISYPEPPKGWVDGVYFERVPVRTAENAVGEPNFCRRFRERESSGWGVYEYHEGAIYEFDSAMRDYAVEAVVRCGCDAHISAYCDGVKLMSGIAVGAGGTAELTFTAHTCGDTAELTFSPDIEKKEKNENDADGANGANEPSESSETEIEIVSLRLTAAETPKPARKPTLFLASDSTVQTYDQYYYPQTGWGEVLYRFFSDADYVREYRAEGSTYSQCRVYELPKVKIENRSIGGRSSRSFFLEGKWDELLSRAHEGDCVLIQFGHNDCTKARPNRYVSPDDYKEWVRRYVTSSLARGMEPVLVSPVMRRNCGDGGEFTLSFGEFREKLIELSAAYDVPLLDLGMASLAVCRRLGADETKALYLHADAGEYEGAYEGGVHDDTHLSRRGALRYAQEAARLICSGDHPTLLRLAELIDVEKIRNIK